MGIDVASSKPSAEDKPRLLHDSLNNIPQSIRYSAAGFFNNVIFLTVFNLAVASFDHLYPASRIYSVVYLIFIPFGHAVTSIIVFGWPKPYLSSLLSNAPIGLTAMALGTVCTGYLDSISFNETAEDFLASRFSVLGFEERNEGEEPGEFYSSLAVTATTGVWSYVLSMMINAPKKTKEPGKEL
mmetsp:Transcript_46432/g.140607  ORF Transcript_46432/g.140607 Transcript_46432/m.140607 type:complete len:184 (+) Transcript_46432:137-688(+)